MSFSKKPASAFCHSASALCLSLLFVVVCPLSLFLFLYTSEDKHSRERAASQAVCSSVPHFFMGGDAHSLCVVCLGAKHAESALEGADKSHYESICHCVCFAFGRFSWEGAFTSIPRRASPAFVESDQRLRSWESQTKPHQFRWAFEKHIVCTSTLFAQAYYDSVHLWPACLGSGACAVSFREKKKEQLIVLFPAAFHFAPTGHALRSVAAIEIAVIEAWIWRTDWRCAHPISTYSPDLALSQVCSLPPLSDSTLLQLFSPKRLILFLYPSGSRVAEATRALQSFSVHIMNLFTSDVFTCLVVWLHLILRN